MLTIEQFVSLLYMTVFFTPTTKVFEYTSLSLIILFPQTPISISMGVERSTSFYFFLRMVCLKRAEMQ